MHSDGPERVSFWAAVKIALKLYLFMIFFLYLVVGVYQEAIQPKQPIGAWIRSQLGHKDFHDFLAT